MVFLSLSSLSLSLSQPFAGTIILCTLYNLGLKDDGLLVTISINRTGGFFNLHRVYLSLHRGPPFNVPIGRTLHCLEVMPANDMNERVFGQQKFPCLSQGSIPVPSLEASAQSPLSYHTSSLCLTLSQSIDQSIHQPLEFSRNHFCLRDDLKAAEYIHILH